MTLRYKTVTIDAAANVETYISLTEKLIPKEGEKIILHSIHPEPLASEVGYIRVYFGQEQIANVYHATIDDQTHLVVLDAVSADKEFTVSVFASAAYTVKITICYEIEKA